MPSHHLYIFSGLGVDERVFQKMDFSGFEITHIKWIIPENDENIEQYASRLLRQVKTQDPVLIGLSFGGMMAIEVAKQIKTSTVILISSAKTKNEIPFYYRLAGKLQLHRLIPASLLKKSNFLINWLFGATNDFEKQLLKNILADTDPVFLNWAINKIVTWKNKITPSGIIHIHGKKDRILPIRFVHCDYKIDSGHLMVLNKAEEIINIIRINIIL
jgi:pimeloyl-ACP methyl ester carboxylesterase